MNSTGQQQKTRAIDLSKVGKSRRLAKQNKDYLSLLSVVHKSRVGFEAEQATLKSKPAREAAKQLVRQLDLILNMVLLPYKILAMMEGYAAGYERGLLIAFGREPDEKERLRTFKKMSKRTMQRFFALDVSGSLSRPWLFAITVYIWTAFECLAGDLWESAINHTTKLAHRTLNSLPTEYPEQPGISRRQIDVGLAARHGFDLRRCLGTVLKPKFDFTKFGGITAAYTQTFGTCGDLEKYCKLKELEQVRHLIVHRGGVADEKFLKLTKVKAKKNAPLPLPLSQIGEYMMTVTLGCLALLKVVDDYFTAESQN